MPGHLAAQKTFLSLHSSIGQVGLNFWSSEIEFHSSKKFVNDTDFFNSQWKSVVVYLVQCELDGLWSLEMPKVFGTHNQWKMIQIIGELNLSC